MDLQRDGEQERPASGEGSPKSGTSNPARMLGDLEARVMQVIWASDESSSVREVRESVDPKLHYNTVLTIMERLERKGILGRRRHGRAHVYYPKLSQEQFARSVAGGVLRGLMKEHGDDAVAAFVDVLDESSPDAIERLQALLQARSSGASAPPMNGREDG
jgi:predicted transcriptional regulator